MGEGDFAKQNRVRAIAKQRPFLVYDNSGVLRTAPVLNFLLATRRILQIIYLMNKHYKHFRIPLLLLAIVMAALLLSAINPYDRATWLLEVSPVIIAIPILLFTARKYPLTPLTYQLIFIHMIILIIGGYYTYARVPLGFWMQDWLDFTRNNYDRIGHFVQGFVPAIIAREVLLRWSPLKPGKLLFTLVTSFCLAFSAFFELFEWQISLILGHGADEFLALQGDIWDTQADMTLAMIGAIMAQLTLSRLHNRQLRDV